jgi:hypothetical protein
MPMSAVSYVKRRQRAWAIGRGIPFNDNLQVAQLADNLFEPLGPQALQEFQGGDGDELGDAGHPGHMYSLRSSSAAAVNVFHRWQAHADLGPIAQACRIPSAHTATLHFEARHPIDPVLESSGAIPPNVDVEIRYGGGGPLRASAFECKLTEPFSSSHGGLKPRYLHQDLAHIWQGLPNLHALAQALSPADDQFTHLHAAQLIKHVLGLKASYGTAGFRLVYLWTNVPGEEAVVHAREVETFKAIATGDGVAFQSLTYQELILRLAEGHRRGNEAYVDYLVARYL